MFQHREEGCNILMAYVIITSPPYHMRM